MKAFVTGVAGFAGSHLADLLLEQGHQVSGIFLPGTSTRNLEHLQSRIELHEGDLLQPEKVYSILQGFRPDWKPPGQKASVGANRGFHKRRSIRFRN